MSYADRRIPPKNEKELSDSVFAGDRSTDASHGDVSGRAMARPQVARFGYCRAELAERSALFRRLDFPDLMTKPF